jgi:predicted RNA-binding protein YlqC (UPF0109 family)
MDWLVNYVGNLVQHPDQVAVSENPGVQVVVVNLTVADDDRALFSGRNNRLVRAMGSVLALAGAKTRKRYVLKVDA